MQSQPSNPAKIVQASRTNGDLASVQRRVVEAWRALTGGSRVRDPDRRTLVACSAGADSSALAIALASATDQIVLGHVVHDLRPAEQSLADRDRARDLAQRLGVGFCEAQVFVEKMSGNAEANARKARYAALEQMALDQGCPFVATAHHAEDQLETVLMAAARGSGLAGLSGIEHTRGLGHGITLVRPMLQVRRAQSIAMCDAFDWTPALDASNLDTTRTRAALRHGVLKKINQAMPTLADRVGETAELLREADRVIGAQADALWNNAQVSAVDIQWQRQVFLEQSWLVVAMHLRAAHARLLNSVGKDRLSMRLVMPTAQACVDGSVRSATHRWWCVVIVISRDRVKMRLDDAV